MADARHVQTLVMTTCSAPGLLGVLASVNYLTCNLAGAGCSAVNSTTWFHTIYIMYDKPYCYLSIAQVGWWEIRKTCPLSLSTPSSIQLLPVMDGKAHIYMLPGLDMKIFRQEVCCVISKSAYFELKQD